MEENGTVSLVSLDSLEKKAAQGRSYSLSVGCEYHVGRDKKCEIVIDDKRCSRKQALLSWDASELTVTPLGTNPCYLCPRDGKPVLLTKNKPKTVGHEEKICFLALEAPFVVRYHSQDQELSSDDEDMEAEILSEEEVDDRPHCKYGSDCYQKNPQHLRKFYHPHKDAFGKPREKKASNNESEPKAVPTDSLADSDDMDIDKIEKETKFDTVSKAAKEISQVATPSTKIIPEEDEERLEQRRKEVNKKIAEKQAEIFKQNIAPRKIVVAPKPTQTSESKSRETEKGKESKPLEEYPHKKLSRTLLFPPLSIDKASQCDVSKASKVLCKELLKFLHSNKSEDVQLILLDDPLHPCGSVVNNYLQILFKKNNLPEDKRFSVLSENQGKESAFQYRFVACPVSWRFKPNHPISRFAFQDERIASLVQQVKDEEHTATCGHTHRVVLSDLFHHTQVLLLVNPPNFHNERKPNCLNGDYERGLPQLESCYAALFQTFAELCTCD